MVEVSLTVGKLDASLALLLTREHHLIEFPTILLPKDVQAGSIVKISCERDEAMEIKDTEAFMSIQDQIMQTFGTDSPKAPALRVRNVTETSAVLEWDPIEVATAEVISLTLYKNGARFGIIPSPLTRTAIKLSGLAIDTAYSFDLVLATSAGTFRSGELNVKTHKMTDLTGITLCVGTIEDTDIDLADLEETIKSIGAKPLQDTVRLDTTHFVCTVGEGPQWKRALAMNIPVVRPEWIKACEAERRLVSVRAYYLNADPKLRPPVQRSRALSQATEASTDSTGHRRAVSEIADSPFKPQSASSTIAQPEPVPEGREPEDEANVLPQTSNESQLNEVTEEKVNGTSKENLPSSEVPTLSVTAADEVESQDLSDSPEPATTEEEPRTTSVDEPSEPIEPIESVETAVEPLETVKPVESAEPSGDIADSSEDITKDLTTEITDTPLEDAIEKSAETTEESVKAVSEKVADEEVIEATDKDSTPTPETASSDLADSSKEVNSSSVNDGNPKAKESKSDDMEEVSL